MYPSASFFWGGGLALFRQVSSAAMMWSMMWMFCSMSRINQQAEADGWCPLIAILDHKIEVEKLHFMIFPNKKICNPPKFKGLSG